MIERIPLSEEEIEVIARLDKAGLLHDLTRSISAEKKMLVRYFAPMAGGQYGA